MVKNKEERQGSNEGSIMESNGRWEECRKNANAMMHNMKIKSNKMHMQ